jgi:hypothetical protein
MPVRTFSFASTNGATTRTTATTRPVAKDAATINLMCPFPGRRKRPGCRSESLSWVVMAKMASIRWRSMLMQAYGELTSQSYLTFRK